MAEPAQLRPFSLLDEDRPESPALAQGDAGEQPEKKQRAQRSGPRPRYAMPTERIAWPRHPFLLRTFAVIYTSSGQPVSGAEVANIMKLAANTASLNTSFLVEAGLLVRADGGRVVPADVTLEYARAYEWNADTAGQHLAPALRSTWFGKAIEKRLLIQGNISVTDAVEALASEAGASAAYQPQIRLLIDYLELAKIIERTGDSIKLVRGAQSSDPAPAPDPPAPSRPAVAPAGSGSAATTPPGSHTPKPLGGVQFSIAIDVDMAELSTWSPDRLSAFFTGLAAVIAAKEGTTP